MGDTPHEAFDPREEQLRALIETARGSAQCGDIAAALRYAREALAQRSDCSTTHALLGQLYEQQGDLAAARYHFQAALNVTPEAVVVPAPLPVPQKQPHAAVLLLVLIGCILISGLAALFAFRPSSRGDEQSTVLFEPGRRHAIETPRWTMNVPTPMLKHENASAPPVAPATTHTPDTTAPPTSTPPSGTPDSLIAPPTVLGPSAHAHGVEAIAGKPSLEAADQAFFRGEYDKAVTLYEAVLPQEENLNPRVYHDLAWCYQQLGNSQKASEYLGKAVQGYQAQLASEPSNIAAQQGLASCQAALHTISATHDGKTP